MFFFVVDGADVMVEFAAGKHEWMVAWPESVFGYALASCRKGGTGQRKIESFWRTV